jgi:hypothetical protein
VVWCVVFAWDLVKTQGNMLWCVYLVGKPMHATISLLRRHPPESTAPTVEHALPAHTLFGLNL